MIKIRPSHWLAPRQAREETSSEITPLYTRHLRVLPGGTHSQHNGKTVVDRCPYEVVRRDDGVIELHFSPA